MQVPHCGQRHPRRRLARLADKIAAADRAAGGTCFGLDRFEPGCGGDDALSTAGWAER